MTKLFYSDEDNKTNLCYMLEFHADMRSIFGSIASGSSFKFGLFYHKKSQRWTSGTPHKPIEHTEKEAIEIAESIRDNLVKGAEIICNYGTISDISDYKTLYNQLQDITGIDTGWVLKYYQMLFPAVLPPFYGKNMQIEILRFLKEEAEDIPFMRMGQIELFIRKCGISSVLFGAIYHDTFAALARDSANGKENIDVLSDSKGSKIRYWMYAPGDGASKWEEFYREGIMGLGWDELGDYRLYQTKNAMRSRMREIYDPTLTYTHAAHATWQFLNEIKPGDIIFVKKGRSIVLGRGVVTSEYEFAVDRREYKSIRQVNWTHKGEWPHPGSAAMKTLTDITNYTEYVEKLNDLFASDDESDVEETRISYDDYGEADFLNDVYMEPDDYESLVELIHTKKNIILQGAPGVGKTFMAKRLAYSMMGVKDQERVMMIQFHQSFSYEDFIMGYRPSENGFELKTGSFYNFCKKAELDSENEYFFIIDEINRGNLSKIFGELFMLIENDKRGIQLQLLYSGEKFSVPKNLYLIGMMNTADRSLAMMDYALRRRFSFFEMRPGFETEGFRKYRMALKNEKFDKLIRCVENLNDVIASDDSLGDGFCIGHSYFCNLDVRTMTERTLRHIVEYDLIPLLKEYWFDEPQKVRDWSDNLRGAIK